MQNEVAQDPLIGTVIHNYVVRKRLAAGGMGCVYLADHQDPRSASKKVIKILLPEYSRHPVVRERFEREALAVMRLKHPYIVEIDNLGTLPDGQLYLMMEFLDGETLEDHLQRRGRCTLHHTLHIIAQVMSALQSLHEAGLVHRDLKPANIFILATEQNPYEVRLIDLGIARDLAAPEKQKTMAGAAMGTPGYMAVEQYEDAGSATPAADVYAAAVIAWRMLFGEPPWGHVFDDRVLYFKQRAGDFQPPADSDIAPEVVTLLRNGLAVEPTERPTVADFVNVFASLTPAMPPFVPSGARILNDVAKRFLRNASANDETVRNVSHASLGAAPMSWPPRGTTPGSGGGVPVAAVSAPPGISPPPTANERPRAPMAPHPTTLSASSGVIAVPPAPSARGKKLALLGGATAVIAAVAVFAIVQVRGGRGNDAGTTPAMQPTTAAQPSPPPASSPPPPAPAPASRDVPAVSTPAAANPAPPATPPTGSATAPPSPSPTPTTAGTSAPVAPSGAAATSVTKERTAKKKTTPAGKGSAAQPPAAGSAAKPREETTFDPNAIVE